MEKRIKNRAHFNLTDFYNLRKVKYTLELENPLTKKLLTKGQYIYTLDLKEEKIISKLIDDCKENGHKRVYIDFGLHI